jgi:hypothetical protein
MTALYYLAGVMLTLCILYVLALRCRRGHKTLAALQGWSYAHRGLHGNGVPENSMEAFRLALEGGYGIELDVHLMKDGRLAVIHDASLKRTAGAEVFIEDLTAEDLENYTLEDTQEHIPLLTDVLAANRAGVLALMVEPVGGPVTLWQKVLHTLQRPFKALCREDLRKKS